MIHYVENKQMVVEDLLPLYQSVGWSNYTDYPERLEQAFQNSLEEWSDVYQIELVTDQSDKTLSFYQGLGFRKLSDSNCTGLIYVG